MTPTPTGPVPPALAVPEAPAAADDAPGHAPDRPSAVRGTVLRLCSVYAPSAAALARVDAAAYDPVGGMQNHTENLTVGLDRLGLRQHVVTSRLGGPAGTERVGASATVARVGLPTRQVRQAWALSGAADVLRRAGSGDVGLVHAHQGEDLAVLPLAALAARRAGVPLVVTLHCSVRHTLDRARRRPLTVLGPAVELQALRRADAVFVLTGWAADAAVADGVPADRVHVLPSGYDPALFDRPWADPVPSVPHPRVLFLGRLAAQKRPLDAVAAHALLDDDVQLVVVGDGPLRPAVEAAVAASPARDRVHLLGLAPHGRVPAYLAHADAFVLPSQYEELGSVLVEAMAAGAPVVANDVGGIPALVRDGETGLLAPRGDVPALAARLREVLEDPGTARERAAKARALVEREYAWPSLAEQVAAVYAQVQSRAS